MDVGYKDITNESVNILSLSDSYCIFVHNLFSGVDWVYTAVENLYIYDYKIIYFWLLNNVYSDNIDFFFLSLWYINLSTAGLQLFWSTLLDIYISNNLIQFSLTDEWVRSYISSKDASLLIVYHPEIIFFKNQMFNNFFFEYLTDVNISIISFLEKEKLITPIMLIPQLVFIFLMVFIFVSFFFSFYTTSSSEESTIDSDYLSASVTIESEKEIGSLDDILMPAIIFIYTFGWYFYLHCWNLVSCCPELTLVLFFFPMVYYTILNTPTYLLYDFGIFFNCYLRGIAPSSILVFELLYDYIAVIAFYVRVLVQGVRLVLMFLTYAAMHDCILYMNYNFVSFAWANESIWEALSNVDTSTNSITYFILSVLPGHILYWMYELFHTFFVLTGQLVAYFAMVFWLFLFLFTFFTVERQENYFFKRKLYRKFLLKEILKIKS